MILNIELNPTIEKHITVEDLKVNDENLIIESIIELTGPGIIIEEYLNIFGVKSRLTGFLGIGAENYLNNKGLLIDSDFVPLKDEIHRRYLIKDGSYKKDTILKNKHPIVTVDTIVDFYNLFHSLSEKNKYIILSDQLSDQLPMSLFRNLIKISRDKEKLVILEINSEKMLDMLNEKPNIVVTNKYILESLSNLKLDSKEEIARATNYIFKKGVGKVFINLYDDGIIYSDGREFYHVLSKNKNNEFNNNENQGIVAGYLIGMDRNFSLEMILKLCSSYNIFQNTNHDIIRKQTKIKKDINDMLVEKIFLLD